MVSYTNRKGKAYYLHMKTNNLGTSRFHFATDKNNTYVGQIPDGYEIYEHPNAQVFLRKIPPQIITELEIQTVKKALRNLTDLHYYIIDVRKNCIGVFSADECARNHYESFKKHGPSWMSQPSFDKLLDYTEEMRFILDDKKARLFQAQRFCYRGRIDDWINIGVRTRISELAKKYVIHIGKDSYFELSY